MSNRRKSAHERGQRTTSMPPFDVPTDFNQMARKSCSECGAPVEWVTGAEAESRGHDLTGGLEFLGLDSVPGKDIWVCTKCDNFGIMGPTEGFF